MKTVIELNIRGNVKIINNDTIQEEMIKNIRRGNKLAIMVVLSIILLIKSLIELIEGNILYIIMIFVACVINIYTIRKSQSAVLTKNGKREQNKLLELKKFMTEYSQIENYIRCIINLQFLLRRFIIVHLFL